MNCLLQNKTFHVNCAGRQFTWNVVFYFLWIIIIKDGHLKQFCMAFQRLEGKFGSDLMEKNYFWTYDPPNVLCLKFYWQIRAILGVCVFLLFFSLLLSRVIVWSTNWIDIVWVPRSIFCKIFLSWMVIFAMHVCVNFCFVSKIVQRYFVSYLFNFQIFIYFSS